MAQRNQHLLLWNDDSVSSASSYFWTNQIPIRPAPLSDRSLGSNPFFPPAQKGHSCDPLAFRLYANKSTDPNPVIERSDLRCPAAPRWKPSSVRTNTRCWYRCVHVQLCLWGDAAVSSWVCSNLSGTKIKPCFLQRFCDEDDDGDDEDEGFINLLNPPTPPPCCGVLTARLNSNSRLSYANDPGELRPTNGGRCLRSEESLTHELVFFNWHLVTWFWLH